MEARGPLPLWGRADLGVRRLRWAARRRAGRRAGGRAGGDGRQHRLRGGGCRTAVPVRRGAARGPAGIAIVKTESTPRRRRETRSAKARLARSPRSSAALARRHARVRSATIRRHMRARTGGQLPAGGSGRSHRQACAPVALGRAAACRGGSDALTRSTAAAPLGQAGREAAGYREERRRGCGEAAQAGNEAARERAREDALGGDRPVRQRQMEHGRLGVGSAQRESAERFRGRGRGEKRARERGAAGARERARGERGSKRGSKRDWPSGRSERASVGGRRPG